MNVTGDIEKLRRDMIDECMGAYFGGGIGPALLDAGDIEDADPDKLVAIAQRMRINNAFVKDNK